MPASLNDWADRLRGQPLPAMSLTIQRITRLIDSPSTTNADYQRVIGRDPGFTLSLFRHFVDSGLTPREPVTTLAHSIALLGLAPVIEGTRLPRIKKPVPGGGNQGIYRCYAQGAHAAWYASNWAQALGEANPEEMGIAALLHHCGEMALWANAREEMRKIERHVEGGLSQDNAALAVLGFTLGQLSQALAGRWGLPPLTQEALQPFGGFRPRAIGVMLAAELARASSRDWGSDETRELLELVAERQHLTLDRATGMVHRLSVELARELRGLPLPVAAFDLILSAPPATLAEETMSQSAATILAAATTAAPAVADSVEQQKEGAVETAAAPLLETISPAPPLPPAGPEENPPDSPPRAGEGGTFQPSEPLEPTARAAAPTNARQTTINEKSSTKTSTGSIKASASPRPVSNYKPPKKERPAAPASRTGTTTTPETHDQALQQSFGLALRKLHDSAGMDRAMFAMLTPDKKSLRARFVIGAGKEAPIRRFQLNVEQRHLFSLLLTKPQEFWLNSSNRKKYLPLIPSSLHDTLDTRGFFVTSVFVRNRPLGILYGDCSDASTLDQHAFARFKQITRQLCDQLGGAEERG